MHPKDIIHMQNRCNTRQIGEKQTNFMDNDVLIE